MPPSDALTKWLRTVTCSRIRILEESRAAIRRGGVVLLNNSLPWPCRPCPGGWKHGSSASGCGWHGQVLLPVSMRTGGWHGQVPLPVSMRTGGCHGQVRLPVSLRRGLPTGKSTCPCRPNATAPAPNCPEGGRGQMRPPRRCRSGRPGNHLPADTGPNCPEGSPGQTH